MAAGTPALGTKSAVAAAALAVAARAAAEQRPALDANGGAPAMATGPFVATNHTRGATGRLSPVAPAAAVEVAAFVTHCADA